MTEYGEAEDIVRGLSAVLGESARFASPEILEQRVLDALSRLTPSEAESFTSALGDVGRFFKSSEVRGVAGAALPIVGTAVGTVYGGPVGAAIGGSLGGAAGQAIAGTRPAHAAPPPQPAAPVAVDVPVAAPAGPVPGTGPVPGVQPLAQSPQGGSAAAAQLLNVIQNPALLSSLLALVMGSDGKTSVPIGSRGTDVPVGAMMNLVGVLANRAAEDAEEILAVRQDGTPAYLFDESGCLTCDPAVPSQRADALLRALSAERDGSSDKRAAYGCAECAESWDTDGWW
jgi:hypothetical protein